uniref:Uncharacterized protein n=1 Tax=Molossus molossus TaxID=27622 RepID=A0A7J8C8U0_MOLMO|nr:hypothetical protein HJG59_009926 [Molossus molossus]
MAESFPGPSQPSNAVSAETKAASRGLVLGLGLPCPSGTHVVSSGGMKEHPGASLLCSLGKLVLAWVPKSASGCQWGSAPGAWSLVTVGSLFRREPGGLGLPFPSLRPSSLRTPAMEDPDPGLPCRCQA